MVLNRFRAQGSRCKGEDGQDVRNAVGANGFGSGWVWIRIGFDSRLATGDLRLAICASDFGGGGRFG